MKSPVADESPLVVPLGLKSRPPAGESDRGIQHILGGRPGRKGAKEIVVNGC
jgi:hypothetical protein